ncbi:hypothetical protein DFH06DRAFT_1206069 [Mycena polygramma]|nr:hypothetical protein DFH06DRAFT_1206069 [Mycena polygramma]
MITDLGTDILLHIFSLADVYTILTLSQVNRLFNEVGLTKQLWISVLRHSSSCYPPPGETWDDLTTDALIQEVRRAADGPRTWSCGTDVAPTLISQTIVPVGDGKFAGLLPGDTHIFSCRGVLDFGSSIIECFEVESGRRVWGWERAGFSILVMAIGFCGDVSNVMVALSLVAPGGYALLVLKVDLSTGKSIDVLHIPLAAHPPRRHQFSGDFYVCSLYPMEGGANFLLLLNWRAEEFVLLDFTESDQGGLLPGHLVTTSVPDRRRHPQPECPSEIKIHPLTAFKGIWLPLTQFDLSHSMDLGWLPSARIPVAENGNLASSMCWTLRLFLTPSILHHDTYDIAVSVTEFAPPPVKRLAFLRRPAKFAGYTWQTAVTRYRMTISDDPASSCIVPKSVVRHSRVPFSGSNAGYGLTTDGHLWIVYPLHEWEVQAPKPLPIHLPPGVTVALTPCGAIVVDEGEGVIEISRYL